jgi:glycosyltransferase involved in cell wall biosynthesis
MGQTYHPLIPRPAPSLLSVVIPIYNEEEVVPILRAELTSWMATQPYAVELVLVNDGSTDRTIDALLAWGADDARVMVIGLARNFGHQAAITAGLDTATGDAVVVIDADLQDPPAVIPEMVKKYEAGYDIVYGRRLRREGEPVTKKLAGWAFYRFMRAFIYKDLPTDTGDFRLVSRRTLDVLKQMRETHRFVRGLVAWLGFPATYVHYSRPPRAAGESKYPWRRLARLAWMGAISFSPLPLRISLFLGLFVAFIGLVVAVYALVAKLTGQVQIAGWTSQVIVNCLIGGAILVSNGMLGEYVGRIFESSKGRPLYVVSLKTEKKTKMEDGG